MLFYDAAMESLKNNPGELTDSSIETYQWNLKKLYDFSPELDCSAIDERLIREFKAHMQELGNKPATVTKALSVFRIFVNRLRREGLIENDPFKGVRIGRVYTRRGFLTVRELKMLYLNFSDNKSLLTREECECVKVFLFSRGFSSSSKSDLG